ncbi:hypothetical protein [Methylobacterium sp. E-066]|uniref:hypothetical protein n=1 Tax=Methylobacterium sp. E-066 TaxID=2836584 RepID=UPI001FB88A78|nr:hypothetical protein [Methylobacterium sp. E-066]MCJ2139078.1 hypothetical protein [Methylobacterium sp. E-066]
MSAAETAIDDSFEAAVLERAQQNFLDNGPGNRLWADPSSGERSTMNACFTLSAAERATFIAVARAEIETETARSRLTETAQFRTKVRP